MRSRSRRSGRRRSGGRWLQVERRGAPPPTAVTPGTLANCPAADDLISNFDADNSLVAGRWPAGRLVHVRRRPRARSPTQRAATTSPSTRATRTARRRGALHVKGTGFAMWGAAMGVDWQAASVRRRRRVRRQDDVRRQPVPRHRVLGEVVGAARRRAGQLPRPLHRRGRAAARHARSDRLQPAAALQARGLPLHLQRGLPATTAARTWCSSASRATPPRTCSSPATRTSRSTRPGSAIRCCSSTRSRTPATAATTRRPTA